jgi:aspartate/methionine/tyrosine aminotransferase
MRISQRASSFTESVIREMTRLAMEHDAINLAQGFPDFPAPQPIKDAACRAVQGDVNQYAVTWGAPGFRRALADKYRRFYGMDVDPDSNVCVTCGATEAMIASMMAIIDPGDEVVVFEPYYENYGPDVILAGAVPRYVTLRPPDWTFDEAELRAAFSNRTRGIIINTPNNPTGKVFAREELVAIADLCQRYGAVAFTDEIYEHIVYDGARHVPMATLPGMEERTVTISAMSKSYSVTGWRVGWAIASRRLTRGIRTVHDFLTVGAPAPLQEAGVVAASLPDDYYALVAEEYHERRNIMMGALERAGLPARAPAGAYYVLADITRLGFADDVEAAHSLVAKTKVATVPGSSFFSDATEGARLLRFSFSKRLDTLREAAARLADL